MAARGEVCAKERCISDEAITRSYGDKMGYPRPPAFLDPSVDEDVILQNGLSYASGGGGILNDTGSFFVQKFSLYKQIELFQGTKELIRRKIGDKEADKFFGEASYTVSMGSNDFINSYLMPLEANSWTYSGEGFINLLMTTLREQLKLLYILGARNLTFFGLGPLGCIPLQRMMSPDGGCQDRTNQLAVGFNEAASGLITGLSNVLPNATFKYGDAYDVVQDVIANPHKYGMKNTEAPCCTLGKIRPTLTCTPLSTLCSDRSLYAFWDEYHPTERANEIVANEIISKLGYLPVNATNAPLGAPV
ncbi:GDSL esterase/lipase At1g74460-like isoform X2 [Magnolia sinica]|uniref:GDSL esterase/lipase At1g74460-like isoform X2 n=1 Tax=Magnolia sinica TaxID=86752 RepID=UPI002658FD0B|nr:GDSL esterase/lipase At1g74460-like isoform X2 [Magnolia sinica]